MVGDKESLLTNHGIHKN